MTELPSCRSDDSLLDYERSEKQKFSEANRAELNQVRFSTKPHAHSKSNLKSKSHASPSPKLKPSDLKHLQEWQDHRHRVKQMAATVDSRAPGYQAARQTGVCGLYQNAVSYMARTKANLDMLLSISAVLRTHGVIDSFRYERVYTSSSLPFKNKLLERIDEANYDMGKRIIDVVSEIDTGMKSKSTKPRPNKSRPQKVPPFSVNQKPLDKYKGYRIRMPKTDLECWKLLRPHIYFDLNIMGSRPLGRIVIELCTEAAPAVVLELVRACTANQHTDFVIRRLFPDLWLNVELSMSSSSDLRKPLEYDARIIDHGVENYVLSFSKDYVKGFSHHFSYSMSFKPLRVANGSRVGFGRVIKNSKILDYLQSFGTKNGVLRNSIVFSKCGIL